MAGAALPLPARIIRTTFITDKCAFWSFRHVYLLLLVHAAREDTEYPHQVSVADSHFRLFIHFGLRVIGDAKPCCLNHRQVVGAIADSHGLRRWDLILFRQLAQRIGFIFRIDDIAEHVAGELAVADLQLIGEYRVEMQFVAQILAKKVKPPEAIATFQPSVSSLSTSCARPGISGSASRTCSKILASASFSVATRWRRLAVKSSSPRIARSVTSETSSPVPASFAISSMHSI